MQIPVDLTAQLLKLPEDLLTFRANIISGNKQLADQQAALANAQRQLLDAQRLLIEDQKKSLGTVPAGSSQASGPQGMPSFVPAPK